MPADALPPQPAALPPPPTAPQPNAPTTPDPINPHEPPLPLFVRPVPGALVRHPVLAAVLGELRSREARGELVVAFYEDSPYD